jgi:hypothetical protein
MRIWSLKQVPLLFKFQIPQKKFPLGVSALLIIDLDIEELNSPEGFPLSDTVAEGAV